jgi:disulfide bond formation protein DsbB
VNAAATAPLGSLTRWVLLVCTLVGLAAMHTIGHTGPSGGTHSAAISSTAVSMPGVTEKGWADSAAVPCPDGHCDDHGAMDFFSVCMAVLQGLAVAVLLALLLLTLLGGLGRLRAWERATTGVPRAPPVRRTGLTIAAISVLRI